MKKAIYDRPSKLPNLNQNGMMFDDEEKAKRNSS